MWTGDEEGEIDFVDELPQHKLTQCSVTSVSVILECFVVFKYLHHERSIRVFYRSMCLWITVCIKILHTKYKNVTSTVTCDNCLITMYDMYACIS